MGKPLAGVDTYIYGRTGLKITAARSVNGDVQMDLFVYKQCSANSFILQTEDGEILDGKFTLTGFTPEGIMLDPEEDPSLIGSSLGLGYCCILFNAGSSVNSFIDKILLNKCYLSTGNVVYFNFQ